LIEVEEHEFDPVLKEALFAVSKGFKVLEAVQESFPFSRTFFFLLV
jgi:hypothetical protein